MAERKFPGKLLLFGEYTILDGGRALAIPLHTYSGAWSFNGQKVDSRFVEWSRFLKDSGAARFIDLERFDLDVQNGLTFISDIPLGYGVGSSGALSAALLTVYGTGVLYGDGDLSLLKSVLADIESFFHGKSSGLDPLVSYTDKSVVQELGTLRQVDLRGEPAMTAFLIDSGISRKTESLVGAYREMQSASGFEESCLRPLQISVEHAIGFYLMGQPDLFFEHLSLISGLQRQYFGKMIPPGIEELWDAAAKTDSVRLKLCGAGGGGFFLGFATNIQEAERVLSSKVIPV